MAAAVAAKDPTHTAEERAKLKQKKKKKNKAGSERYLWDCQIVSEKEMIKSHASTPSLLFDYLLK